MVAKGEQVVVARKAIKELAEAYAGLTGCVKALSDHVAQRSAVERAALPEVMQMPDPSGVKMYSMTGAKDNLDLSPAFAEWRAERNRMEAEVEWCRGRVATLSRTADLEIMLVRCYPSVSPPVEGVGAVTTVLFGGGEAKVTGAEGET